MGRLTLIGCVLLVLLLVTVGCDRKITGDVALADNSSSNCFTCHSDSDIMLVEARTQYEHSKHAEGETSIRNHLHGSFYGACERCHTAEGFLAYVNGEQAGQSDFYTPISCFTCHAPHSNGSLQLRVTTAVTLEDGATFDHGPANLCATCHHSREDVSEFVVDSVETSSHFGPHHGPQSDMLIGTNAYEYAGYTYANSPHSQAPEGCIHCHMASGEFMTVGGHSWNMADTVEGIDNVIGCNNTEFACHSVSNPVTTFDRTAAADYDWNGSVEGVQTEVQGLLDSLAILLENANLRIIATDSIVVRNIVLADTAGALFNYEYVKEDRSLGVHNTAYTVGLLQSSIEFLDGGAAFAKPGKKSVALVNTH